MRRVTITDVTRKAGCSINDISDGKLELSLKNKALEKLGRKEATRHDWIGVSVQFFVQATAEGEGGGQREKPVKGRNLTVLKGGEEIDGNFV